MSLSPEQRRAVEREGQDVCVTAGPGSGKTRVLIERFRWLVEERGVPPPRVLAITFTEKAALEIRQRLAARFGHDAALREQIERAYVSTIHGFAMRLLKENAIAAGLDPEFTVLDASEAARLLDDAFDRALGARFDEDPRGTVALVGALDWGNIEPRQALAQLYEASRLAGIPVERLRPGEADMGPVYAATLETCREILTEPAAGATPLQLDGLRQLRKWAAKFRETPNDFTLLAEFQVDLGKLPSRGILRDRARRIRESLIPALRTGIVRAAHDRSYPMLGALLEAGGAAYRAAKRRRSALDFTDLEEQAIRLLEGNEAMRERLRGQFGQILMDEIQDTNRLQWALVDGVRREGGLFAVGDINQSIYGFRHAEPEVFRAYRTSLAAGGRAVDELRANHRSRGEILAFVNTAFRGAPGVEPHALSGAAEYPGKDAPSIECIAALAAPNVPAAEVEAEWVARRIREIEGALLLGRREPRRPAAFRDIAVLVRSLSVAGTLAPALDRFGVPWLVSGGRTFFEAREVLDLTNWLAALANPLDEVRLAGVLRSPLAGLSDESIWRLKQHGSLWEAPADALEGEQAERLAAFRRLAEEQRRVKDETPPDRLLARVVDETGYAARLAPRAKANLEKLFALVREQFARRPLALAALVEELDWRRQSEADAVAPPDDSSNAVRVMTVHAAKGLEFPVVFLPALQRGVDTTVPPLCFTADGVLGARWTDPATGGGSPDPVHAEWAARQGEREKEEEHRLLYVATTRAEEHLVLSASPTSARGMWKLVAGALGVETRPAGPCPPVERLTRAGVRFLHRVVNERPACDFPPAAEASREEEELIEPAAPAPEPPSSAAVTAVAQFAFCPRQYWLDRQQAETRGVGGAGGGAELGIAVHRLLAGEEVPEAADEARALAAAFSNSEWARRAARASRCEREFDFVMAVGDMVLEGQIDLWFSEGGELALVDYKTDAAEHPARYGTQLRLYALALERLLGRRPDKAVLVYLRTMHEAEVSLDEESMRKTAAGVEEFRAAHGRDEWPLHEGAHCAACPFHRGACPAGG